MLLLCKVVRHRVYGVGELPGRNPGHPPSPSTHSPQHTATGDPTLLYSVTVAIQDESHTVVAVQHDDCHTIGAIQPGDRAIVEVVGDCDGHTATGQAAAVVPPQPFHSFLFGLRRTPVYIWLETSTLQFPSIWSWSDSPRVHWVGNRALRQVLSGKK